MLIYKGVKGAIHTCKLKKLRKKNIALQKKRLEKLKTVKQVNEQFRKDNQVEDVENIRVNEFAQYAMD